MNVKGLGEVDLADVLESSEKVVRFLSDMAEGKAPEGELAQDDVRKFFAMMGAGIAGTCDFYRTWIGEQYVAEAMAILRGE